MLPGQQKCIFFADVAGSTALFESRGNAEATRLITGCTDGISRAVKQSVGKVVKLLGDGVLATFLDVELALGAARTARDTAAKLGLRINVGIELGDVVERDGDVFGDAVNVAARLSDVAQNGEILLSEAAYIALDPTHRQCCRSLSKIPIKGKAQTLQVWRYELRDDMQTGPISVFTSFGGVEGQATRPMGEQLMVLRFVLPDGQVRTLRADATGSLIVGRTRDASLQVEHPRVSRVHAEVSWQFDHFVIADQSSNGTWLRFEASGQVHMLRRGSMAMVGAGQVSLGAPFDQIQGIALSFEVVVQD